MLNEIFKGMANASEAINENFQKMLISTGTNENGRWIRMPIIKLQICVHTGVPVDIPQSRESIASSSTNTWTYPRPFAEILYVNASGASENRWVSVHGDNQYLSFRQWGYTIDSTEIDTNFIAIGFYE